MPGQEIRLPSFGGALKVDEQSDGKHDIFLVLGDFRTPSGVRNSSRKRKVGSEAPGGNKQTFYLEIVDGRQRPRLGNSAAP